MSESNRWFRDKWNRFEKLKYIEDNWVDEFNDKMFEVISDKYNKIERISNGNKKVKKNKR